MPHNDHIVMPENHMEELYSSKNTMVRFVHNRRLKKITDMLPDEKGQTILDAGCGEGHLLKSMHDRFPDNSYYGVDITNIALKHAEKRCPFADLRAMDIVNLDYKNDFFDVIVCTEVIEHIYKYEAVIAEFSRVLKRKGILIISFPNEPFWTVCRFLLGRRPIKVPDHVNSFTPRILEKKINMQLIAQESIPFPLNFNFSLGCVMKFKK